MTLQKVRVARCRTHFSLPYVLHCKKQRKKYFISKLLNACNPTFPLIRQNSISPQYIEYNKNMFHIISQIVHTRHACFTNVVYMRVINIGMYVCNLERVGGRPGCHPYRNICSKFMQTVHVCVCVCIFQVLFIHIATTKNFVT